MFRTKMRKSSLPLGTGILLLVAMAFYGGIHRGEEAETALAEIGIHRGICVVLGLPDKDQPGFVTDLAEGSELLIYFQSPDREEVTAVRQAAEDSGLLGTRIFVDQGGWESVHLADNLAGAMWVSSSALGPAGVSREEILRVLHPEGTAVPEKIVKPFPEGIDSWSHPYHGPDNNPQSMDEMARYPYLTQFLGYPLFGCISEVTVASEGRLFKAFGHIAFKTAQNEVLNKLYCINSYNGTILWTKPLKEGFMIHRNTMIATPDALYLADDESCKLIDPETGETSDEIVLPGEITGGTVWKWMALEDGILYALVGGEEIRAEVKRAEIHGYGNWPWGMWEGYDYKGGAKAFGFGRNFIAIDPETKEVLWHHPEEELLDSRGICMKEGRIYYYSPAKFLACLNAANGEPIWRTSDRQLLEAIGPNGPAQDYRQGFSTSVYIKCNGKYIFFAGPQRSNLVAVSCKDGKLAWFKENGNCQLVLREDALYAIGHGPGGINSFKYQYDTGEILAQFLGRRACTRATGSFDSIFYRASGGTIRYVPSSNSIEHIAPMRPPCHDGVIISDGMLHWGPWICACALSLYGNIGLAPAGDFDFQKEAREDEQLEIGQGDLFKVNELKGEVKRNGNSTTCGGMIFTIGSEGIVKATDAGTGKPIWKAYTGGGINFPPAIWQGRAYVGSNDGWVYAFEAATGRLLWRFRAAPVERRIPVYGKLMSTWPVAGGVVASEGVVYAAAGIAHYDGTHVYALDAVTGEIKWHNNSSGSISDYRNGISLQGQLHIEDGKLTFCGGNAYPDAVFDVETGQCLTASHGPNGVEASTFYAVEPYLEYVRQGGANSPFRGLVSATETLGTTKVGRSTPLEVSLMFDAPLEAGNTLWLDLTPLGLPPDLPLEHAGEGRYAVSTTVTPLRNGHHDLPIMVETAEGERYSITATLDVYPDGDLVIYEDEPGEAWSVKATQAESDLNSSAFVHSGSFSHAISLGPAALVWYVFDDPAGIDPFGYSHLEFYINGGESSGQDPMIGSGLTKLQKLSDLGFEVQAETWRLVSIPISVVAPEDVLKNIYLVGKAKETFYIDDMKLVAEESSTSVEASKTQVLPSSYVLYQNYPNPFNATTQIYFGVPEPSHVKLSVYNILGREVAVLVDKDKPAGWYRAVWNAEGYPNGLYVYQLNAGDFVKTRRMILLK